MFCISEILVKYNYVDLTYNQMADIMDFSNDEKNMLNIFWEPTFNTGWIYLSPNMIIEDMGYKQVSAFYRDNLYKSYIENIDYIEIKKDDDLVKKYNEYQQNISKEISPANIRNKRGGHNAKYYKITGKTLKKMLMKCGTKKGDQICEYYLKVEQLAIFMKDYINALHKHILETKLAEKDKVIEDKNLVIENKEAKINRIHILNEEYLSYKKLNEKNETIYIVSTYDYATQGIYKVGKTTKLMKSRTSGHNTTHVSGDKVKVLKEFKVNDCSLVEKIIHKKLKGLLVKGDQEIFMCPYDLLENLVDVIVNDDNNHNKLVNTIIDTVNTMRGSNYNSEQWTSGIDMSVFNIEMRLIIPSDNENNNTEILATFNITSATEIQKKAFVEQCIIAYKQTIEVPQILVWKTFQAYLFQQLSIPRYQYKALQWKPIFKEVESEQN
jgi:hypothetical protein